MPMVGMTVACSAERRVVWKAEPRVERLDVGWVGKMAARKVVSTVWHWVARKVVWKAARTAC